ncbi:MAG: type II secretion system protein [Elusimicrobia bacterium]|nr:type II secretion system protein [Elusimicrobiota bacterium]
MTASSRPGFTLVELTVAVLILAIVSAGVLSAVLSSTVSAGRTESRWQASLAAERLRGALKRYVIAHQGGEPSDRDLESLARQLGCAPGRAADCVRLEGDGCRWALQAGCAHDATALLRETLGREPVTGRMSYTVADDPDGGKQVAIRVDWEGPVP